MKETRFITRYNHRIPHMRARIPSGLRPVWLTSFLLATVFLATPLLASTPLAEMARQLARKIGACSGPGSFALDFTNRSSLDDKSVREVLGALETELQLQGVHAARAEQAIGTIVVVLGESLREYVWTAEIVIGSDEKKVVLVALPRPPAATPFAITLPTVLKTTLLFTRQEPILDLAVVEVPGGSRLLALGDGAVALYRQPGSNTARRWELESSLPISHARTFPRDLRGRLLLRRDRLFDVYLPDVICRSRSTSDAPLALICNDSDDPWPLTSQDDGVRAFYAPARNFFTGALSPGIGKISTLPSFYSAAAISRSNYTLWALAAVDGSLHLVDGMTDQRVTDLLSRGVKWGSDLAAVHSACGSGTQLLVSDSGNPDRDALRAFEVPDRDPVPASAPVEFEGQITALWPEGGGSSALAVIRRKDTTWFEAYRVSISCPN